jgi:hypothetical protein
MQSISSAVNRFHEDTAWLVRAKETELSLVRARSDLG